MKYKIVIDKPAMRFLKKQPAKQKERLLRAIYRLPFEGYIKAMAGDDDLYRLHVGTYRVIFSIENDILTVRILTIGNRGDVYK